MNISVPHFQDGITSLPQLISNQLRQSIIIGELQPGQALRQEQIADQFQVSRVPVREALKLLESEGLVILLPRRGYFVAALDIEEIKEVFDIRMLLEGHAASIAAENCSDHDIEDLEDILLQLNGAANKSKKSVARWAALNRSFHERINTSSGRKHLCRVASMVRVSVERFVYLDVYNSINFECAEEEHRAILNAIRQRDKKMAGSLAQAHCKNTRDRLLVAIAGNNTLIALR